MVKKRKDTNKDGVVDYRYDEARLIQWLNEERNPDEDYKKAFGDEPSMISGLAIMTDTDNTGESATAYYGDILFKK
jgi:hypothetical protein